MLVFIVKGFKCKSKEVTSITQDLDGNTLGGLSTAQVDLVNERYIRSFTRLTPGMDTYLQKGKQTIIRKNEAEYET